PVARRTSARSSGVTTRTAVTRKALPLGPVRLGAPSALGGVAERLDRAAFVALAALFATIPWQDVVQVPGVGTVAKATGAAVLVVSAVSVVVGRGLRRPGEAVGLTLLLTAWVVLSTLWSRFEQASLVKAF